MNTSLRLRLSLLLVFLCLTPAYPLWAVVYYVDAGATGANNGSSWTDAYNYLQDALAAAGSGSEIWVAQGTYKPDANTGNPGGTGDRAATFQLENGVAIYGGFPTGGGSRDPNTYVTILSGDIGVSDDYSDNSYHVVTGSGTDSTAVLDGFTITQGYADGSSPDNVGGGMVNYSGSPALTNCIFTGNQAMTLDTRADGGGIYNDSSSPTLTNCTFSGNRAGYSYGYGGGMYNTNSSPNMTDCNFTGNQARGADGGARGGGIYNTGGSPTLTNCTFSGNSADGSALDGYGGGMYNVNSNTTLTNCSFSGNQAYGFLGAQGGGIYNTGGNSTLTDCNFSSNSADTLEFASGGGIYNYSGSQTLTNCTFSGNQARGHSNCLGGGIHNYSGSQTLTNCTFSGNEAYSWGVGHGASGGGLCNEGGNLNITNCIFSGNQGSSNGDGGGYGYGGGIYSDGASSTLTNCTLSENSMLYGGYGSGLYADSTLVVTNCIIWGNTGSQISGSPTVNFSDIQGGWAGTGNIDADPCFVTGPDGNYYLSQIASGQAFDSPCVDAGSDTAANLGMDVFNTRTDQLPDIGTVDMGYHYSFVVFVKSADIDKSWHVDFLDFAILAADWLECSDPCDSNCTGAGFLDGDIIQNYYVNYYDLEYFVSCWLDCYVTEAADPQPSDGVDPNNTILEWSAGDGAIYHDVYLGTDADAVANAGPLSEEFKDTVSETSFDPGILDANTTYYWRIDEIGPACSAKGSVWSFTTWNPFDPNLGLVSWWKFDEGSGSTAYDSAGNNDGTVYGATWTSGQIDGALSFDGANDYVQVNDDDTLDFSGEFSLSAWVRPAYSDADGRIIYRYDPTSQDGYFLTQSDTADGIWVFMVFVDSLATSVVSDSPPAADSWTHVLAKRNSSGNLMLYINAVLQSDIKTISGAIDSSGALFIGVDSALSKDFCGKIDDVRFYNKALSAGEIQQLYQEGL